MRCSTCKNCLSAIKKGHLECLETFNYKKSKTALETAARHKQRDIYNFLKRAGCPRSFVDEIHSCADNDWKNEFYSFFRAETPDYETQMNVIRHLGYAAIKHDDILWLRQAVMYFTSYFYDAFANVEDLDRLFEKTIKSEHVQKIELIYNTFIHRSQDWSPSDFEYAIATGNMNTLKCVIEMWRESPCGLRGVGNQIKLATIKDSRLDMLQYLDRFIPGYPDDMFRQLRIARGKNNPVRRDMITYVVAERHRVSHEQNIERNRRLAERDATLERGRIYNEAMVERGRRMEQAQAQAQAPVVEKVTNLHKALAIIEDCEIPEGKYLELCNLLMDVHKRGVRA